MSKCHLSTSQTSQASLLSWSWTWWPPWAPLPWPQWPAWPTTALNYPCPPTASFSWYRCFHGAALICTALAWGSACFCAPVALRLPCPFMRHTSRCVDGRHQWLHGRRPLHHDFCPRPDWCICLLWMADAVKSDGVCMPHTSSMAKI